MKVILLQDVAKIGKRFSVVNVPDGYAINQLVPKKLALPATPENLKRTLHRQATAAASKEASSTRFATASTALGSMVISVAADANEQSHLFQAIHESDIVKAAHTAGIDIDETMVKIKTPIKALGEHAVSLVSGGQEESFTISVIKK